MQRYLKWAAPVLAFIWFCNLPVWAQQRPKVKRPRTLTEAVKLIRPAIVQVSFVAADFPEEVARRTGKWFAAGPIGTGLLVSSEGHVLTAYHVIRDGNALLERVSAARKRLEIGIPIPDKQPDRYRVRGSFTVFQFDVIDKDEVHDLVLLKARGNPFQQTRTGFKFGNQEVRLKVGVAVLSDQPPAEGTPVAVSGYPLGQPVLVTNAGVVASSAAFKTDEPALPVTPEWIRPQADVYLLDVETNPGNSGGPAYRIEDGAVIGLSLGVLPVPVRDENGRNVVINGQRLFQSSGLAAVVPARYIVELLRKNGLK